MRLNLKFPFIIIISIFILACQDDDSDSAENPSYTPYQLSMTDAPGNFTEVNIDIESVNVHSNVSGWVSLNTRSGIYNLLDFNNGIDTVIAKSEIPSGKVSQIRFVLGDSNSVKVDGMSFPLTVPSGSESGLKLQVNQTLVPNITYTVLVDFDVAQSVVKTGNGDYILKPVLRVLYQGVDGAIKGDLNPNGVYADIFAVRNGDTTGATPDSLGNFLINGLEDGNYDVFIEPASPFKNDTLSASVSNGSITDLGVIQLQQ